MAALLVRVAAAVRPGERAVIALANVIRVLRRCPWMEGDLLIELEPSGEHATTVHLYSEHRGVREPALPPAVLAIPIGDLERELEHGAEPLAPVRMVHRRPAPHTI